MRTAEETVDRGDKAMCFQFLLSEQGCWGRPAVSVFYTAFASTSQSCAVCVNSSNAGVVKQQLYGCRMVHRWRMQRHDIAISRHAYFLQFYPYIEFSSTLHHKLTLTHSANLRIYLYTTFAHLLPVASAASFLLCLWSNYYQNNPK